MIIYLRSGKQKFFSVVSVLSLIVLSTGILFAGCIEPGYQPNHDVLVIKLSSNGSLEWSKVIDKGGDDKAGVIIPTNDGGSIISINFDNLIRFSKDGAIVWEKSYMDPGCMVDTIIQLHDGNIVTGSSATGVICKIDTNGNLIWNQTVKSNESIVISPYSFIETNDGVTLVAGNYLARIDDDGKLAWQRSYVTESHRIFSVIGMKKNEDLLGLSQKNDRLYVLQLDRNGTIITNSSLGVYEVYPSSSILANKNGYSILFFNMTNSTMETVHVDMEGNITNQKTLMNATIPTIIASDEGYLSGVVLYPDSLSNSPAGGRKISVGIKKMDINGIEMWTKTPVTFCKPVSVPNFDIKTIVQTSDSGYVILGSWDNFWKC